MHLGATIPTGRTNSIFDYRRGLNLAELLPTLLSPSVQGIPALPIIISASVDAAARGAEAIDNTNIAPGIITKERKEGGGASLTYPGIIKMT